MCAEYWISSIKVITVVAFVITGLLVNAGINTDHRFIGFDNWRIPGAPFVNGFEGFAKVFVTASFACMLYIMDNIGMPLIAFCSWRHRKLGYHCGRNQESITQYAARSEVRLLAVSELFQRKMKLIDTAEGL